MNNNNTVSLVFAGDFCPNERIQQHYLNNNSLCVCDSTADLLRNSDYSIVNLECPLTVKPQPIQKLGPNLSADPACAKLLANMGFDAVTLANNHIMDHGSDGLLSSIDSCKAVGLEFVGAGENLDQAKKPLFIEVKGYKIAFIACAENEFSIAEENKPGANPLDIIQLYQSIVYAKENADITILIIHGGHELYDLPSPRMVKTYRFFADLGVSAVVGHHTHCVSGHEWHNGVPIFYSLGNYLFDRNTDTFQDWFQGMFAEIILKNGKVDTINLHPFSQCKDEPEVTLMKGDSRSDFFERMKKLDEIIRDKKLLNKEWGKYILEKTYEYIPPLLTMGRFERFFLKRGLYFGKRHLPNRLLYLLNLIQCESHRDLSLANLKNMIKQKGS